MKNSKIAARISKKIIEKRKKFIIAKTINFTNFKKSLRHVKKTIKNRVKNRNRFENLRMNLLKSVMPKSNEKSTVKSRKNRRRENLLEWDKSNSCHNLRNFIFKFKLPPIIKDICFNLLIVKKKVKRGFIGKMRIIHL